MKILKLYVLISCIFLHLLVLAVGIVIGPAFYSSYQMGSSFTASQGNAEVGEVLDVSTIEKNGLYYRGYKVSTSYGEQYLMGTGMDHYEVGDRVKVMVQEHPYGPIKSLMVVLTEE